MLCIIYRGEGLFHPVGLKNLTSGVEVQRSID